MSLEQKKPHDKIVAVFVTMNRYETALTCLDRLIAQSRPPESVLIVDNASLDSTKEQIHVWAEQHPTLPVKILPFTENLGNAGGMEIAVSLAFEEGADSVWILDDDSWPAPEALAALTEMECPSPAIRSSLVLDPATSYLSWPLQIRSANHWKTLAGSEKLPEADCFEVRRAWLGALIPREIYAATGKIDGRLFLRGEDEEYPRRIEENGYQTFVCKSSVLHHPPSGALMRIKFFNVIVVLEKDLKPNNLYYRLRNQWWLTKRSRGPHIAFLQALIHLFLLARDDRNFSAAIQIWRESLVDCFRNKLGPRKIS